MEDVLDVYKRPYDPRFPHVCLDEASKQMLADIREPLAMESGKPTRQEYEYEREGTCSIFLACEPLTGKRYVKVTAQRTKIEWALFMQEVMETQYQDGQRIILVMDHLNTGE
jgi:hypothetical protein